MRTLSIPVKPLQAGKKKKLSFDFFSLLQYREYIAGLSVSEDSLACVLLRPGTDEQVIQGLAVEPLPLGIIKGGILCDEKGFTDTLAKLWQKIPGKRTTSVILSLPPEHIWLATLEFPKSMSRRALDEAVNLYLEFSLPFPKEEAYIDWELIEDHDHAATQQVMFGAARKSIIQPYLAGLEKIGITAIAVESHVMSAARHVGDSGKILLVMAYPRGVHLGAYAGNLFRFQRFVPWKHMKIKGADKNRSLALEKEIQAVVHFLRTETHAPFEVQKVIKIDPLEEPAQVIAKGAAKRGALSRKDDTIMSFTAVGTEEIYEWKRAVLFSAFFSKLSLGLGIFFLLLFISSYFFVSHLARRAETRQAAQAAISQDLVRIQEEAKKFNQAVVDIAQLQQRAPKWGNLFDVIKQLVNPGITIFSLTVDEPSSVVISGVTKNRDALLQFKASIAASGVFQDVELPFALIVAKENAPFRLAIPFLDKNFLFKN